MTSVRILGPVDVLVDEAPVPVSGSRRKAVLAVLALHQGTIASSGRIIDAVWGDSAPPTAVNTLQRHVSYLRQLMHDKDAISFRNPGYVLNLGPHATDVDLAHSLIERGRRSTDPAEGAAALRAALDLWRDDALVDVTGLGWLDEQAGRLGLLRWQVQQTLIGLRLRLGEHALLVGELERLVIEHPFEEPLHAQLMLALYRSGRQADALGAHRRLRRALDENLGIDPSPALRELEAAILSQDPALDWAPTR
jgi:DNA-binding SARP family transcriptional activator